MGVLDVEHRVIARLLGHLCVVKIERRVVLARQHDEAHDIFADFVDQIAQG